MRSAAVPQTLWYGAWAFGHHGCLDFLGTRSASAALSMLEAKGACPDATAQKLRVRPAVPPLLGRAR
eukprot:CAMPEP_0204564668 /NCGR_PEP_ID=MMETSP0661-20131031/35024_1 /ASSEMBLY_ACC=CAM_ASM_000606 /TAXON_ID=109239 /ORGANISM="Alexandrium margalefi, Strain AMGDE01CS-322" /LENGTH=66 /DNA_ID=CAMNT_0051572337 /DNA_START=91 /DNA_END=287 /DNA_ORIENTATION=-